MNAARKTMLPISSTADILANALINESLKFMRLNQLARSTRAQIVAAQLRGYHLVSVSWSTGEFALLFCERGTNILRPEKIIAAYHRCRLTSKVFPQGVQS